VAAGGRQLVQAMAGFDSTAARRALGRAEVLITGWGTPEITDVDLDGALSLRAILHAGGQASSLLPASFSSRGIQLANAGWANGIPVAEFTVAMIVLANKSVFAARELYRQRRSHVDREDEFGTSGNAARTVGVVGASRIGRMVLERLAAFDLRVLVFDPFVSPEEAATLGALSVSLEQLMTESDVVTLHPPLNAHTTGMITRDRLAMMRNGATLLNTSRGLIVDQAALVEELVSGRLNAIIDVTSPEVLERDNPLYDLPNVFLTPHIAGSMGHELRRMGDQIAEELGRVARGEPLAFPEKLR
jgi:phosphoglycerate dehydrogenase-like enzyme